MKRHKQKLMIKKIIYRLLERRHYWRYIDFSEMAELYTSMLLRTLGLSLIGIFIPIYLYKNGYQIDEIILFFVVMFAVRLIYSVPVGWLVGKIGPKHVMLLSTLMQIASLLQLLTLVEYGWPLWTIAVTWSAALSMFFIAYHVDFSKVMHIDHGGKELGYMTIIDRAGNILGPLVGGVIATVFGAQYTIAGAIVILTLAVVPLFLSAEPTKVNQSITFRHLNYRRLIYDFSSWSGSAVESMASQLLWPLFVAATIFTVNVYASIGLVTSIGMVAAMFAAHGIGKLIDKRKGGILLKWSTIASVCAQLLRPFVTGFGGVALMNSVTDFTASGYRLPHAKGFYDRADSLPGYRIAYIVMMENAGDIVRVIMLLALWGVALTWGGVVALKVGFIVAGCLTLLVLTQRFPALKQR